MFFVLGAIASAVAGAGAATGAAVGSVVAASTAAVGGAVVAGAAAGGAVVGGAVAAGTAIGGAASVASGTLIAAGSTAAGTIGGMVGSALSTAAEMATVAAAESSVLVGQIPIVGESISGAVQTVGSIAGKASAKVASSMGLSTSTANTIGTIATGTTTNEINKQILRPYNEIKDEITGLSELKSNLRILDDIAHGRMDMDSLQEIVENYKDEIIKEAVDEVILDNFEEIDELKELQTQVQDIYGQYKNGKLDEDTLREAFEKLLEENGIDLDQLQNIENLLTGDLDKEEMEETLLEVLGDWDADSLDEEIRFINDLKDGNVNKEDLIDYIQNNLDCEGFEPIQNNQQLLEAIEDGKIDVEGLSAIIATAKGVNGLLDVKEVQITNENINSIMSTRDCMLSSWLTIPQTGEFYDIFIPRQNINNESCLSALKFFPESLITNEDASEGNGYLLDNIDIQHIGEPVVYAVINYLASADISFQIKQARRKVIITDLGEHHLDVLDAYCQFTETDYDEGFAALDSTPCEIPLSLKVEEAASVVQKLKNLGCSLKIEKCGDDPGIRWDVYLTKAGINEFSVVKILKNLNYDLNGAIKLIKESYKSDQLVLEKIEYKTVLEVVNTFKAQGASLLLTPTEKRPEPFEFLNKEFEKMVQFLNSITKLKEGEIVKFGNFWQSNEDTKEPIEWILLKHLENKDGKSGIDGYHFISKYGLAAGAFDFHNCVEWNNSTVRTYLDEWFLESAFNPIEVQYITEQIPEGGPKSRLFLLKVGEAERYFVDNSKRSCKPTAYAIARGAYCNEENGNGWWWLRSKNQRGNMVISVNNAGGINTDGFHNSSEQDGMIRPSFIIEVPRFCEKKQQQAQQ